MNKPTLTQASGQQDGWISFRCPEGWKRQVAAALKLRGETMQAACIRLLSEDCKVEIQDAA
jgi:hypothetical protein